MKNIKNKKSGFIQITILIVGALVVLRYFFDIDVVGFFTKEPFTNWLEKMKEFTLNFWGKYGESIKNFFEKIINPIRGLLSRGES